jgi:hypothetical protein
MPVESMVLVKVCVLCGDYGVLEIGRDFSEWNEFVALVIRLLVNPGLPATLDVYRGCGWIDPPGCHQHQCGKQPEKPQANHEPSNEGP